MITTNGKTHIKRYLAGHVPSIAQCIAYGIGGSAESAADTSLQFEVGRAEIMLTSYDFANDRLIFKAVLPEAFSAQIYEVALFSQFDNPLAGNFGSKVLASFDSSTETWTKDTDGSAAVYSTSTARLGGDSLSLSAAASTVVGYVLNDVIYDMSGNSGSDVFKFAYNASANVSVVTLRFRTDASNYYLFNTYPSAGYKIDTFTKGSAVVTGNPSWSNITSIEVRVQATAGGTAVVDFDGIRIEDTDTVSPEYVMVSRELLATQFTKTEGKTQEVEFSLSVNV